jgi:pyrroline-5-carboxylate reductase
MQIVGRRKLVPSAVVVIIGGFDMNIGIIGFGNLGRALASGLVMSGYIGNGNLFVCDTSHQMRLNSEKEPFNGTSTEDVNFLIRNSDIIFLSVRSRAFDRLSEFMQKKLMEDKIIVSFMAGVSFEKIYSLIGDVTLVRAMPSLAIATCEGVIGYTKSPPALEEIFSKLGYAFETEPEDIEKVMAFSSCGLGFAAYLIDAFAAAGANMGFSPEVCAQIAALTFKNAVDLGNYRETIEAVATPGGATEEGIQYLDENNTYDIVARAMEKAYERMR